MLDSSEYSKFEREVMDRLIKIETKLDNYEKLKELAYQNQNDIVALKNQSKLESELLKKNMEEMNTKIAIIQDNSKWLARTIGATLIGIAIATIIACLRIGLGSEI